MPEQEETELPEGGRPFWSGTITFGLVSVPVNLLAATRSDRVPLRMVSKSGTPLSRRYFATSDERKLEWDEIVRGYEVEKDRFVVVEDEELERLAPERTRDIDLRVFVDAAQLDPIHFERAYYLTPAGESTKAYRLLARAMEETGRIGIATFVMRAKEYLVAIIAENGILRAETLRFADEVRTPEDVGLPEPRKPAADLVRRLSREIEKREASKFDEKKLVDESRERLLALARKKSKTGKNGRRGKAQAKAGRDVIDLMEMLQRSLQGAPVPKEVEASGGGRDLDDLSKEELYEQAKALDIPGRSGMSKQDLVKALRRMA